MLTETQYKWALSRVDNLANLVDDQTPEEDPARIEYEILSEQVVEYSNAHFDLGTPSLVDLIKLRMYERGLSQASLSKMLGVSESRISEILSGKCDPTYKQAREMSRRLDIDPAVVLGV